MRVSKIMSKDVQTCGPDAFLCTAAEIMWQADCGFVPVVNGEGQLEGVVTDRDLCMAAYTQGRSLDQIAVREAMAGDPVVCSPKDSAADALKLLSQFQLHRLPVVDAQKMLAGVVSLNDLARHAASGSRGKKAGLSHEAVGMTLAAVSQRRKTDQAEA